jgi:hypothetical protein
MRTLLQRPLNLKPVLPGKSFLACGKKRRINAF